jgi:hypothetical protein
MLQFRPCMIHFYFRAGSDRVIVGGGRKDEDVRTTRKVESLRFYLDPYYYG